MKKNIIELKDVSFKYKGTDQMVVKQLNIAIQEGEFVCILGKSGCGKSTVLRLIAGLEKPTENTVLVNGKPVVHAGLDRGIVFQNYCLFPWFKAGKNIDLAIHKRYPDKSRAEVRAMTMSMLNRVGLSEEVYYKYPRELSGGMQQRCAIARSLAINSPILLMDEPFGALDAVTRNILQELLLDLWNKSEEKKTVFFVTHDVDEALRLATRILILGQSPSNIIYERKIPRNEDGTWENAGLREEIRNDLLNQINADVEKRS